MAGGRQGPVPPHSGGASNGTQWRDITDETLVAAGDGTQEEVPMPDDGAARLWPWWEMLTLTFGWVPALAVRASQWQVRNQTQRDAGTGAGGRRTLRKPLAPVRTRATKSKPDSHNTGTKGGRWVIYWLITVTCIHFKCWARDGVRELEDVKVPKFQLW